MDRINKPWGYEEIIEKNKSYVVKKLFMKKGHCCSLQYHEKKHETICVLSGVLEIEHGHNKNDLICKHLKKGEMFICEPYYIHRMKGVTNCIYIECSTTELDDVVRLMDDYGRIN